MRAGRAVGVSFRLDRERRPPRHSIRCRTETGALPGMPHAVSIDQRLGQHRIAVVMTDSTTRSDSGAQRDFHYYTMAHWLLTAGMVKNLRAVIAGPTKYLAAERDSSQAGAGRTRNLARILGLACGSFLHFSSALNASSRV